MPLGMMHRAKLAWRLITDGLTLKDWVALLDEGERAIGDFSVSTVWVEDFLASMEGIYANAGDFRATAKAALEMARDDHRERDWREQAEREVFAAAERIMLEMTAAKGERLLREDRQEAG